VLGSDGTWSCSDDETDDNDDDKDTIEQLTDHQPVLWSTPSAILDVGQGPRNPRNTALTISDAEQVLKNPPTTDQSVQVKNIAFKGIVA
jgi:hypothetical protein